MRPASSTLAVVLLVPLLAACGSITDPGTAGFESYSTAMDAKRPRVTRSPILFVHGWNSDASAWTTMVGRFKRDGWRSSELAVFSYNTAQSNSTTAALIDQKVDSILAVTRAGKVHIVTHSMGALSARYYLRYLFGDGEVDALVSLGGPNHGTSTAYWCPQVSCQEMYPNSSFLTALNSTDETWGVARYATWTSPCDEVINPRSSTALAGAENLTTSCMTHSALHEDAAVYLAVRDWVNAPAPTTLIASLR